MRWMWVPMAALSAYLVVSAVTQGSYWLAIVYGALGLGLSWWLSPFQGRSTAGGHADLVALPQADRPVTIYWRPGCTYCLRLRSALGRAGRRAAWVNIWQDADAAAFVRSVNDGNETVPTVVIDGVPHTNPDPRLVRKALAGRRS